jgi:glycosyltransferase involved in cell wall biosynthesis
MKISILVSNLSGNCLVRTYPIAKVLERHFELEIIGPAFNGEVFEPYQDEFCYKVDRYDKDWWETRWKRIFNLPRSIFKPLEKISGDVVYAFKPRPSSFGVGLLAKYINGRPLVLDIEDWEAHDYYAASFNRKCRKLINISDPGNPWYLRAIEPLSKFADEITVVSSFLQNRYGGVMLPHGADCNFFDPKRFDRKKIRRKWGVDNKIVILFAGKATPHKGIKELVDALKMIGLSDIVLMIVGPENEYLESIKPTAPNELLMHIPPQPHEAMPEFLSLADMVVLPQLDSPYAAAQIPGKLYEAMAMAKPIVATAISDIPEILRGCGWVVPTANPDNLAKTIRYLIDNRDEVVFTAEKARKKCKKNYSWDAMETRLLEIFDRFSHEIIK